MNPHIFRAYDIRGKAERDLPDEVVHAIGQAFATLIRRRGLLARVAVGRDARLSGPRIRDALAAGIRAGGCDVLDVGLVPTPVVYFAAHTREVGGATMVTGSHNPPDENGLKMVIDRAALFGDDIAELARIARERDFEHGAGIERSIEVLRPYVDQQRLLAELGPRRLKVVVDAGNGPTGPIAPGLLESLGFEVIPLFCELDGTFPNHHPDPTVEENLLDLRAAVAAHGADLGVAYDGDGDRIGVLDEKGAVVWGDRLLAVLARALLQEVPGAAIVAEVKCSDVLFDEIERHGGRAVMGQVGHSLIKARMKVEGALLAGEMSGHIFFAHRYFGYDDAIHATIRLLEVLTHSEQPLSALLADLPPTVATPELRLDCPDAVKFAVVDHVKATMAARYPTHDIDGVRVRFADGWGLVRASNTGPVLVMRCEASTAAACDANEAILREAIAAARVELGA